MKDYVLKFEQSLFKVGINSSGELAVIFSINEQVFSSKTFGTAKDFSADVDSRGVIHIAAVGSETLTYIRFTPEQSSTTHLMHLPANFYIKNVLVCADEDVFIDYCVKSPEGYACIEYCLHKNKWTGKNIYTSQNELSLLCVDKASKNCFLCEKTKNSYMLINAHNSAQEIFAGDFPLHYVQLCAHKPMFVCGGTIYYDGLEIGVGESVYVVDYDKILYKDGQLKIMICDGVWRFYSIANLPQKATEYIMCTSSENKKIILTKPFPHILPSVEENLSDGIVKEVFHQQRTLFSLQAEIKSLKARLRKLEDEKGR